MDVIPVFKKGQKEDPGNYRPVSLTSAPRKVMEQIILETITKHMKDTKLVGGSQRRFTKRKSCLTRLKAFYNEITTLVVDGKAVDIVYLDITEAFNTVLHNIQMDKLMK
ncbi:mitochondrial enolase superfamily member 1 [Grus japonensis]|uniref:Mitochondrial enolase superfamily member 1 n=1 Tax=Grus japonensis TaxID=30415 RepID=A0ABC9VX48_GRUJA